VAIKILDNFVLGIAGLRFHHRIQELTPHGLSTASRSGYRPTLALTMVMAISPREAHRCCALARPSSKRRDGHHKKALFGKVVSASAAALRDAKQCRHHKDLPCQGPMRSVFRTSSPPQGCRHGVGGTAIKLTDRGGTLETETSRDLLLVGVFPDRDVYLNSPRSM